MIRGMQMIMGAVAVVLYSNAAVACPACYGAKDSPMTAGMNAAILVMLGITGGVLISIVTIFFILWKRNKRRLNDLSQEIFVTEEGTLRTKQQKGVVEWNNF